MGLIKPGQRKSKIRNERLCVYSVVEWSSRTTELFLSDEEHINTKDNRINGYLTTVGILKGVCSGVGDWDLDTYFSESKNSQKNKNNIGGCNNRAKIFR